MSKKTILITAICAVVLCTAGICAVLSGAFDPFTQQMKLGYKLFSEGEYEEAALAFDKAILIDQKSVGARLNSATAAAALERYDMAEARANEALDLDGTYQPAYDLLFELYKRQGSSEKINGLVASAARAGLDYGDRYAGGADTWMAYNSKYIFYSDSDGIWKMEKDGGGKQKIYQKSNGVVFLKADEQHVYIQEHVDDSQDMFPDDFMTQGQDVWSFEDIIEIDVESKESKEIRKNAYAPMLTDGNILYFIDGSFTKIMKRELAGGGSDTVLVDVNGQNIYFNYLTYDYNLKRVEAYTARKGNIEGVECISYDADGNEVSRRYGGINYNEVALPDGTKIMTGPYSGGSLQRLSVQSREGRQTVISDFCHLYYLLDNYIFYWETKNKISSLYRVDLSGENKTDMAVKSQWGLQLKYSNGFLYYIDERASIHKLSVDGKSNTILKTLNKTAPGAWDLYIADNWIGIYDSAAGYGIWYQDFYGLIKTD